MPSLGRSTHAARTYFVARGPSLAGTDHAPSSTADSDPALWDMPPKPKWMRWSTCARLEQRYDRYDDVLDDHLIGVVARLMKLTNRPG
jgi:hypothetical protein